MNSKIRRYNIIYRKIAEGNSGKEWEARQIIENDEHHIAIQALLKNKKIICKQKGLLRFYGSISSNFNSNNDRNELSLSRQKSLNGSSIAFLKQESKAIVTVTKLTSQNQWKLPITTKTLLVKGESINGEDVISICHNLSAITNLTGLQSIQIDLSDNKGIADAQFLELISVMEGFQSLENVQINVRNSEVSDASLRCSLVAISRITKLKHLYLDLSATQITPKQLAVWMEQIQKVSLELKVVSDFPQLPQEVNTNSLPASNPIQGYQLPQQVQPGSNNLNNNSNTSFNNINANNNPYSQIGNNTNINNINNNNNNISGINSFSGNFNSTAMNNNNTSGINNINSTSNSTINNNNNNNNNNNGSINNNNNINGTANNNSTSINNNNSNNNNINSNSNNNNNNSNNQNQNNNSNNNNTFTSYSSLNNQNSSISQEEDVKRKSPEELAAEKNLEDGYGKGFKILMGLGYKVGRGLGKNDQGITEPVQALNKSKFKENNQRMATVDYFETLSGKNSQQVVANSTPTQQNNQMGLPKMIKFEKKSTLIVAKDNQAIQEEQEEEQENTSPAPTQREPGEIPSSSSASAKENKNTKNPSTSTTSPFTQFNNPFYQNGHYNPSLAPGVVAPFNGNGNGNGNQQFRLQRML